MSMSERSARTEEMAIDLGALWRAFWRARFWLVPFIALVAVVAYLGLSTIPPKYRAEAKVLIEARSSRIDAGQRDPEAERTLLDQEGVTSQVQLMTSRDLARRVVQREKLEEVSEFRAKPGLLRTLLPFLPRGGQVSPEQQVLDAYFERLTIYPVEKSRVITVEFVAGDPMVAARVANAVVREYLSYQAEAKVSTTSDASSWLESEITGLRSKVAEAEAKVEQWRASHDLFATNRDGTLVEQQLSGLNTQLATARSEKAAIEARVEQLRKVIASGAFDSSADLQASASYQRLRERETLLRSRQAELSATLLSGHPQMRALSSQIADIQGQERAEAQRVLAALENEGKVADRKLRDLRGEMGDGKANAAKANENDIQLRALEREAKAQRDLLETFLARYRESIARQSDRALPPDARAISEANAPTAPFFPKVLPLTFLVTFAVFMILTAFIILRELVSGRAVRPANWQPVAAGPSPETSMVAVAPVAPVVLAEVVAEKASPPVDPDDPGPGGGLPLPTTPAAAKPDHTPALVADARLTPQDAPLAGHGAAAELTDPDEIAWAVDETQPGYAASTASAEVAAAEEPPTVAIVTEPETLPVTEAAMVAEPAVPAVEAAPSAPASRAAALPSFAEALTGVYQSGAVLVAVLTPSADPMGRAAALAAARRAAGIGRACLVEWAARETPLIEGPGLADLLAGRADFGEVVGRDPGSLAHIVPAGGAIAAEAVADPAFGLTLDALASCYDRLVIDAGDGDTLMPEMMTRLIGVDSVLIPINAGEALAGERLRLRLMAAEVADVVLAAAPQVAATGAARDAA
jgi:uncharacterized protein involved in exopolysaccharide biosynthesis